MNRGDQQGDDNGRHQRQCRILCEHEGFGFNPCFDAKTKLMD
jgi:hypothetical protein